MYCDSLCDDFVEYPNCNRIRRFPSVCNGCENVKSYSLPKVYYKAYSAHSEYIQNIREHKKWPKLTEAEMKKLDTIISEGVKKGHSIEIIIKTNHLHIAPSTIYRYINENLLSVKNIDLKRKVRYKPRIINKPKAKRIDYDRLKGRTFHDFHQFFLSNPTANVWQMETIEGKKGESAISSLLFTKTNLQLYFKIFHIKTSEVQRIFKEIRDHLGNNLFKETFSCILTDNGKENQDPLSIEVEEETGEILTTIFYCEARRSDQKGKCEKNHEHFREMIPKGKSMNGYGQKTINYVSNQVNNYLIKSLSYHSDMYRACKIIRVS